MYCLNQTDLILLFVAHEAVPELVAMATKLNIYCLIRYLKYVTKGTCSFSRHEFDSHFYTQQY